MAVAWAVNERCRVLIDSVNYDVLRVEYAHGGPARSDFTDLLVSSPTCTIQQRSTSGVTDSGGLPVDAWAQVATGIRYRLEPFPSRMSAREIVVEKQIVVAEYLLYVESDNDTYHHRELWLKRAKGT